MLSFIQEKLNDHGFALLVDGVFGRSTMMQLMAFQRSKDLVVDGVAGQKTANALGLP